MPYKSPEEVKEKVRGTSKLSEKKRRQFMHVFNSCYEKHRDDGRCHAMAWGAVKKASAPRVARAVRLDRSALRGLMRDLSRSIEKKVRRKDPDEPLGASALAKIPFDVRGVDGSLIPTQVVVRSKPSPSPFFVTGGGAGRMSSTGEPAIVIELNGRYPAGAYADVGFMGRDLWKHLIHEVTHVADKYRPTPKETTRHVKTEDELDQREYYNDPGEVRAYMQEVVDQVLSVLPKMREAFDENEAVEYALKASPTWREIRPHLNRRNSARILKAVYQEARDHMARAASGSVAGRVASRFLRRIVVEDGSRWRRG